MLKVITDNPGIIAGDLGPKVKASRAGWLRRVQRLPDEEEDADLPGYFHIRVFLARIGRS